MGLSGEWEYWRYMRSTTVILSIATRDLIRGLGGDTFKETIIDALDIFEADRFWVQADAAGAARESMSAAERKRLAARDAAVDASFDAIE